MRGEQCEWPVVCSSDEFVVLASSSSSSSSSSSKLMPVIEMDVSRLRRRRSSPDEPFIDQTPPPTRTRDLPHSATTVVRRYGV